MSLSLNFPNLQENPARASKSTSTPSNTLSEGVRKKLLDNSRKTALKARKNELDPKRGFLSDAFKKPSFKAPSPKKCNASKNKLYDSIGVGSDDDYSDIEEMHIYPEPEDDFEGILPKSEKLTREDLLHIMQCGPASPEPLVLPEVDLSLIPCSDDDFRISFSPEPMFELEPVMEELSCIPLPNGF